MNTANRDRLFHDSLFTFYFVFYLNKYKYLFSIKTRIKNVSQSTHTPTLKNTYFEDIPIRKILNEQQH